jgi:hypothetical protein
MMDYRLSSRSPSYVFLPKVTTLSQLHLANLWAQLLACIRTRSTNSLWQVCEILNLYCNSHLLWCLQLHSRDVNNAPLKPIRTTTLLAFIRINSYTPHYPGQDTNMATLLNSNVISCDSHVSDNCRHYFPLLIPQTLHLLSTTSVATTPPPLQWMLIRWQHIIPIRTLLLIAIPARPLHWIAKNALQHRHSRILAHLHKSRF